MNLHQALKTLQEIRLITPIMNPELDKVEQAIMAYENALSFYANTNNYTQLECGSTGLTTIEDDKGDRATSALEAFGGDE